MNIRQASEKDALEIIRLIAELAEGEGEESSITPSVVRQYLEQPGSSILLAGEDGQVLGLLGYSVRWDLFHAAQTCTIETLIVQANARGRGIGSALLRQVLEAGEREGWAEVSVSTMPDNHQALAFYRKHGLEDEAVLLEKHFWRNSNRS